MGNQTGSWTRGQSWPAPANESLERAMVAGLLLEVVLETPVLPNEPQLRRRHIRSKLTYSLIAHLSGRVTLDRFRHLMHQIEQWFQFYYPLMSTLAPPAKGPPACRGGTCQLPDPSSPVQELVCRDHLHEWLAKAGHEILPRRPQRKMQPDLLEEVLFRTQGLWFRVKDLAEAFDIDRKTAWEYVQKLQDAGLLVHNRGRSAAVRYRLAEQFLKVQVAALRRRVGQVLPGLPPQQTESAAEWLAATAGEPLWEDRFLVRMEAGRRDEVISILKTAAVLEVVCQSGRQRLLRLQPQWLRSYED